MNVEKNNLTEQFADSIVAEKKEITQDIAWIRRPNKSWVVCNLPVKNPRHLKLIMHLNVNCILEKFTCVLLYGEHRVRALDVNGSHENKHHNREVWRAKTHKHKWTDVCHDRFAYTPEDITGTTLEEVFVQFCAECNISFQGKFKNPPPKQYEIDI